MIPVDSKLPIFHEIGAWLKFFFFQNEMKGTRLLERSKGHKLKVKGYNQSPLLRKL